MSPKYLKTFETEKNLFFVKALEISPKDTEPFNTLNQWSKTCRLFLEL